MLGHIPKLTPPGLQLCAVLPGEVTRTMRNLNDAGLAQRSKAVLILGVTPRTHSQYSEMDSSNPLQLLGPSGGVGRGSYREQYHYHTKTTPLAPRVRPAFV